MFIQEDAPQQNPPAIKPVNLAPQPAAKPVPTQMGGMQITSTAGDGFGSSPIQPAVPSPVAGQLGAMKTQQTGQPITSTQGDGFGSSPVQPAPTSLPTSLPPVPASGTPSGPAMTPTDPNNPLTSQTISANPALDRFKLANERFDTFAASTEPAYQSALRDAQRMGAAAGGLGSGQLRTQFGDLGLNRSRDLDTQKRGLFQDALEGSVGDGRFATGVAQQQQGFQNDQQQQAFRNELQRLGFGEDMINSAFGRALQQWQAGQSTGTGSGTAMAAGQNRANQGGDALGALNELIKGQAATPTAPTPSLPPLPPPPARTSSWPGMR